MNKEELKQEAEKYVKQNYCEICVMADDCKCGCIDCFTVQAYLAGAESREKRIAELEEKNAELKGLKDVATLIRANNDTVTTLMQLNNMLVSKSQQLTKAKKIIEKMLYEYQRLCLIKKETIAEAEQFLKEE